MQTKISTLRFGVTIFAMPLYCILRSVSSRSIIRRDLLSNSAATLMHKNFCSDSSYASFVINMLLYSTSTMKRTTRKRQELSPFKVLLLLPPSSVWRKYKSSSHVLNGSIVQSVPLQQLGHILMKTRLRIFNFKINYFTVIVFFYENYSF